MLVTWLFSFEFFSFLLDRKYLVALIVNKLAMKEKTEY